MKTAFDISLYVLAAGLTFTQSWQGDTNAKFWIGLMLTIVVAVKAKLSPSPLQSYDQQLLSENRTVR